MTSKLLEQDTSAEKLYILNEYVRSASASPRLPSILPADLQLTCTSFLPITAT